MGRRRSHDGVGSGQFVRLAKTALRKHWRSLRYQEQGGRCAYCGGDMIDVVHVIGERKDLRTCTLDHVIPRSRKGKHRYENTVACCLRCNWDKGEMTGEEYRALREHRAALALVLGEGNEGSVNTSKEGCGAS